MHRPPCSRLTWRFVQLLAVTVPSLAASAYAETSAPNVFAQALVVGEASAPAPSEPLFQKAFAAVRARTGDPGPLVLIAKRVTRFAGQSRCGRVAFALAQPSSHKVFPQLGGEINVCEDGLPPLQVCADQPSILVPPSAHCANGTRPHNTAEVDAAIQSSIARGSLSPEQARARFTPRAASGAVR